MDGEGGKEKRGGGRRMKNEFEFGFGFIASIPGIPAGA